MPLCWATLELVSNGLQIRNLWEVKDLFQAGDFLKQAEDWTSQASQAATERVVEFNSIYELDCWSGRIVNLDRNEDENPTGATRNAEISQVVSSKCLMVSCKAECRIFWNSLWNCPVSYYFGCNYCLDLLGFQLFLHSLLCQHAVRKHTLEFRSPEENFDLLGALQGMPAR